MSQNSILNLTVCVFVKSLRKNAILINFLLRQIVQPIAELYRKCPKRPYISRDTVQYLERLPCLFSSNDAIFWQGDIYVAL